MKRILVIPLVLLLASCAGMRDLTGTSAAPTYGEKATGETWSSAEHNELYNSVVTGVADIATNTEDIATNTAAIATKMANPMTTAEDIIKGGESGTPTRVAAQVSSIIGINSSGTLAPYDSYAHDDSGYHIVDDGDNTRQLQFILDDITSNNKIEISIPNRLEGGTLGLLGADTGLITGDRTLSADECMDNVWFVTGAYTVTLPPIADYLHCKFLTVGAVNVIVAPNASDKIYRDGTAQDDGHSIDNDTTSGDWAELFYYSADGWYAQTNAWNNEGAVATSCTELYDASLVATQDQPVYIGSVASADFYGLLWTPADDAVVCKIDAYVRAISGTLTSSHDYYARIYSVNAGTNVTTGVVATSAVVPGESMVATTWISANAGAFEFLSPPTLSADTKYAIVFFIDRDGNLDDNPENDTANYPHFGYDDENNGDGVGDGTYQSGRIYYDYNDIGSAVTNLDAEDDILVKIDTIQ